MATMWMVVADESVARIYQVVPKNPLQLLEVIEHPDGRKDPRDFTSDVPGQGRSDFAGHAFSLAQRNAPRDVERDRFAGVLAGRLDNGVAVGGVEQIALVMAPRLLGLVRSHLSPRTGRAVVSEVRHRRVDVPAEQVLREVRHVGEA